jgi:hypothetical protein
MKARSVNRTVDSTPTRRAISRVDIPALFNLTQSRTWRIDILSIGMGTLLGKAERADPKQAGRGAVPQRFQLGTVSEIISEWWAISLGISSRDLEALIAEKNRLALLRFRKRWDNGQMITRVQGDGLGDHPHIAVEVVKPGVPTTEMLAQQSFDRWGGAQKISQPALNIGHVAQSDQPGTMFGRDHRR